MKEETVPVDRETLQDVLQELLDLQSERLWWRNEPRCGYSIRYQALCEQIEKLKQLLA